MEPQLVDYYNDFPSGAILIEKLNSEYEELQKKYDKLEKKYNSIIIIPPKVRVSNVEEFYHYENGYVQNGIVTHWMPLPKPPCA